MEIAYNNIIFNIEPRPPSPKKILVAVPMWLWRVETKAFTYGLDFFQKTVLKLKSHSDVVDGEIAPLLGLDPRLVDVIMKRLRAKGFLNEYGLPTYHGKQILTKVDGLIVDDKSTPQLGYVFQHTDDGELHPYFVRNITLADLREKGESPFPNIVTGEKGDGDDYTEDVFFLKTFALPVKINLLQRHMKLWNSSKNRIKKGSYCPKAILPSFTKNNLAFGFGNKSQNSAGWQPIFIWKNAKTEYSPPTGASSTLLVSATIPL
jgi:hypothetical protein